MIFLTIIIIDKDTVRLNNEGYVFIPKTSNYNNITIDGNEDIESIATRGNGTYENPYVIEDLVINGENDSYGISINNTNKFFRLENCTIYNSNVGVILNNVSYAEIFSCNLNSNINGIHLSRSKNISIISNRINYNNKTGISLHFSNMSILNFNLINNQISGAELNNSNDNQIYSNFFVNSKYAILLNKSNNNTVTLNSGFDNQINILEINSSGNIIHSNFIIYDYPDDKEPELEVVFFDFIILILITFTLSFLLTEIHKRKS